MTLVSTQTHAVAEARDASVRSCAVCRAERSPSAMLRLGLVGGTVVPAATGGRGAYVCAARACIERIDTRNLARAFKHAVTVPERAVLLEGIHALAGRRVLESVGLARRQGALEHGVEAVGAAQGGLALAAADLSPRGRRQLGERATPFVNGDELGRAAGMGWVGAVRLRPGVLAERAAYWLALWYESRSGSAPSGCEAMGRSKTPGGVDDEVA